MSEKLDELKQEADDLGIKYSPNIGEEKLKEKIEAYYKSQETSAKEIEEAVEAKEQSEVKPAVTSKKKKPMSALAKEMYDNAKKTVVVTIIDNDQRVNNQTSTCKVNWTNVYYDMGTRIFPLNTPIEIPQGFVQVLKKVEIPHHTKDSRTGLSKTTMRPRYTIQHENELTAQKNL